jgi:hypothetical protein
MGRSKNRIVGLMAFAITTCALWALSFVSPVVLADFSRHAVTLGRRLLRRLTCASRYSSAFIPACLGRCIWDAVSGTPYLSALAADGWRLAAWAA